MRQGAPGKILPRAANWPGPALHRHAFEGTFNTHSLITELQICISSASSDF